MKDNWEEHFEYVHHNISLDDMNEEKLECAKFRKIGLNNYVRQLCLHNNILQRPINGLVFACRSTWVPLSRHLVSHEQDWPILPQSNLGNSVALGYGCEEGHINMEDIANVFF